jgi:hypothetical protein
MSLETDVRYLLDRLEIQDLASPTVASSTSTFTPSRESTPRRCDSRRLTEELKKTEQVTREDMQAKPAG